MREHSKLALAIFATFFLALLVGIFFSLKILLWPILIGFLISYILDPVVDYFEGRGMSRTVVIVAIFIITTVFLAAALIMLLQPAVVQVQRLIGDFPAYLQLTKSFLREKVGDLQERFPKVDWITLYGDAIAAAENYSSNLLRSVPGFFTNIFGIVASAVIVPFVTFFLLKDGTGIKKHLIELVPNRYFEMVLILFYKVHKQISSYIRGTLLDCSITGLLYVIGFSVIQVKYAIFIGIFSGVANLIPYLGPWLGAGVALIAVVFDPSAPFPWWAVMVVAVIVQFLENNIVYPIVLGRSVAIHPLIIMLGLFVGSEVAGLIGMILAVPVIAVCKVVAEVLYRGLKQYSII